MPINPTVLQEYFEIALEKPINVSAFIQAIRDTTELSQLFQLKIQDIIKLSGYTTHDPKIKKIDIKSQMFGYSTRNFHITIFYNKQLQCTKFLFNNRDDLESYFLLKFLSAEQKFQHYMTLLAVIYFLGQHDRNYEWYIQFLNIYSGEKSWQNPTVIYVWQQLNHTYPIDLDAQQTLINDLLKWKLHSKQLKPCVLTNTLLPIWFLTKDMIQGQSAHRVKNRMLQIINPPWHFYSPITINNTQYMPGWWPKNSVMTTIITDISNVTLDTEISIELPRDYVKQLTVSLYKCKTCTKESIIPFIENLCMNCTKNQYQDINIREYSTDITVFKKQPKRLFSSISNSYNKITQPLLLGCELEYECEFQHSLHIRMALLKQLQDFVIFKHDSSLRNGGFEIVTQPADAKTHLEKFTPVFNKLPNFILSTERTGMHIHLSKALVSLLTTARMIDFMHLPSNREFIEVIGERKLNSYCNQDPNRSFGFILEDNAQAASRSVTLNIAKQNTMEFRIFKAPIQYLSFAKNIEFVLALTKFMTAGWTKFTPHESRKFPRFIEYIKDTNHSRELSRNTYPHLYTFLKEKGVL